MYAAVQVVYAKIYWAVQLYIDLATYMNLYTSPRLGELLHALSIL